MWCGVVGVLGVMEGMSAVLFENHYGNSGRASFAHAGRMFARRVSSLCCRDSQLNDFRRPRSMWSNCSLAPCALSQIVPCTHNTHTRTHTYIHTRTHTCRTHTRSGADIPMSDLAAGHWHHSPRQPGGEAAGRVAGQGRAGVMAGRVAWAFPGACLLRLLLPVSLRLYLRLSLRLPRCMTERPVSSLQAAAMGGAGAVAAGTRGGGGGGGGGGMGTGVLEDDVMEVCVWVGGWVWQWREMQSMLTPTTQTHTDHLDPHSHIHTPTPVTPMCTLRLPLFTTASHHHPPILHCLFLHCLLLHATPTPNRQPPQVETDTPGGYHVAARVLHPADSRDPQVWWAGGDVALLMWPS